ncbi:MAG: zinc finger MYND domain-containing protein [Simkaniaceae bacterium]|jgi:hypothetical protein|nr:MAG: zinc finger MYND domain-containing protein [Simkaniaceae bacterium]
MSASTIPEGYKLVRLQIEVQPAFPKIPRGKGNSVVLLRQQVETVTRFCANCFKTPDKLEQCSTCKKAFYCNRECQREDWRTGPNALEQTHKSVCKLLKDGTELGAFYQKLNTILSEDDFKKEVVTYQGLTFAIFNNPKKRTYVYKVFNDHPSVPKREDIVLKTLNGLMVGHVAGINKSHLSPTTRVALCPTSDCFQLDPHKFGQASKVLEVFNITVAIMNGIEAKGFLLSTFRQLTVE